MKKLLLSLFAIAALSAPAAEKTRIADVTLNTATNVLAGGNYLIKSVTFVNADATNARVFLYDVGTSITNIVRAAYVSYATISSNWTTVFTNASGLLVTNTFAGLATVGTSVSAVTNERPKMVTMLVPASDIDERAVRVSPSLGVTVYATQTGTIEIIYDEM